VVDLPEPVGPGDDDEAARLVDDLLEDLRGLQLVEGEDLGGNGAEHARRAAVLVEGVDAEARQPGDLEGEVDLEQLLVIAALLVVHDVVDQRVHLLVLERRHVDAANVAVHADHRRQPRREVEVRRLVLDAERKEFRNIHDSSLPKGAPGAVPPGSAPVYPERRKYKQAFRSDA